MKTISVEPPNSLILVMDSSSGVPPATMGGKSVSANESCIAIGCLSVQDGSTEIQLAQTHEVHSSDTMVFDGELATPSKHLSICSVMNEELISAVVSGVKTHVRVFTNHKTEPNRISVLFD